MGRDERREIDGKSLCSNLMLAKVSGHIWGAQCATLVYWGILFFITHTHKSL